MGAVVDTGIFIAHERRGSSALVLRAGLTNISPPESFVVSCISLAELVHGIYRAKTSEQYAKRYTFVREVSSAFPVLSFTEDTAWIAGRIRGEQAKAGNTLPFADSLIAAVAIELDYGVVTLNVRDFVRIPGIRVIPFAMP
ncbi:MAG TPA: PIN domain-containing protein [Acidobacteriaceae bacterium]